MKSAHWRVLLVCLIVAVASGCSAIRVAYNNAEFFVYQSLDSFLDFDAQQEQLAKGRITTLLAWHWREELPDSAQWLAKLREVAQRFSPSPDTARRAYFERVNQATYESIALATQLATPQQRAAARATLEGWANNLTALASAK